MSQGKTGRRRSPNGGRYTVTEVVAGHFNNVGLSSEWDGEPVGGFEERSVKIHSFFSPTVDEFHLLLFKQIVEYLLDLPS